MKTSNPKWTILIATLGQREERFKRLLDVLLPQVEKYKGDVRVLAYWDNGESRLDLIRQKLVEAATGDYISFIDDDDLVPEYYCDEIYKRLDGVDYIGWRMQLYHNGEKMKPTFHSLKYADWSEDDQGWYRNISHLNPIKRKLALKASFEVEGDNPEDQAWVNRVAPFVKTEHYISKVMYEYLHTTSDSLWRKKRRSAESRTRPIIRRPYFSYHPENITHYVWKPL